MSKHTPGPWEIKYHPDPCYRYISGPQHIALAQVVWCMEDEDRSPECEANAHLIAAAPELLEALEKIVELNGPGRIYKLNELGMLVSTMLSIARAAIAKAKGEEHKRRTGGTTMEDALARLVRIMGTFDLATGHADTMDQALDALEEELRDVLGHLRARHE